jgi:ribA/ribD-fused uncharacterized protein
MHTIQTKRFFLTRTYHVFADNHFLGRSHMESFQEFGVKFSCVQQYLVWRKAVMFADYRAVVLVMKAKTVRDMIKIGRTVIGFDDAVWRIYRKAILTQAYTLKFSQNQDTANKFVALGKGIFVFSVPHEVYGSGLTEANPENVNVKNHNGSNLVGEVLTELYPIVRKMK